MIAEHQQWFDSTTGEPINNGYVYIGASGLDPSTNSITIYSDRALTTPIANPQRTDVNGQTINKIWIPGKYSIEVEDVNNVQKYISLDNGNVGTDAAEVGFTASGTGVVATTVEAKLQDSVSVKDFGAVGDGVTDDTTAFESAIISDRKIFAPSGTYLLSNLRFTGASNIIISGEGSSTILDFSGVTSGDAFEFTYDASNGGCKNIRLENLAITDTSATSSATTLLKFEGGAAGFSPSRTSAFITLQNVDMLKFNNSTGAAIVVDGISSMTFDNVQQGFEWGCQEGLQLINTANVNTGVWAFHNCAFRGQKRGMKVHATGTLMDSAAFNGCFFANHDNAAAEETILFSGTQIISNFVFNGCHLENRHNTQQEAVLVTGLLYGNVWNGCHLSCGDATNQSLYGFKFEGATVHGCSFHSNEFLRAAASGSGGRCFYFDSSCSMDSQEPNIIGTQWRNTTSAFYVELQSGSSDENYKAVHCKGDYLAAGFTPGPLREYSLADNATPAVRNANFFTDAGTTTITDFDEDYQGQIITIMRPIGTAGTRTITYNTSFIVTKTAANVVMSAGDTIRFIRSSSGVWYEI